MIRALRHRVGQFVAALAANVRPPDDAAARRLLPAALLDLFVQMPAPDRRHGLVVLRELERAGERDPLLLQAALLHDVGKAHGGVTVLHRIARVLLAGRVGWLWRRLAGGPTGWRRPFWVVANHPARGARWVATRGGDPALVELIRHHEAVAPPEWAGTPQGRRHAALAAVDGRT